MLNPQSKAAFDLRFRQVNAQRLANALAVLGSIAPIQTIWLFI